MKKIVVLGAGIAGHTTSLLLKHKLGRNHQVIVVSQHLPHGTLSAIIP